jgi:hypothetical protein
MQKGMAAWSVSISLQFRILSNYQLKINPYRDFFGGDVRQVSYVLDKV